MVCFLAHILKREIFDQFLSLKGKKKMGWCSLVSIATQIMAMSIIIAAAILFVGVGFLVLLHICIVGKAFRAGLSTVAQGEVGRADGRDGLSRDDLEKLPCYDFDGGDKDCAVCLERLRRGEKCRMLPVCRHSFHAHCVDCWLVRMPICPICRTRACGQEGLPSGRAELQFSAMCDCRIERGLSTAEDVAIFERLLESSLFVNRIIKLNPREE